VAITIMAIPGANSATATIDQAMDWQHAVVSRIETLSPRVKSFFFHLPEPLRFRPGQHVLVRLTAPDGYRAQRSYSIASAPIQSDSLELTIERLADGEVSPFMHDVVEPGDEIELGGPIGDHFVWNPEDGVSVLLVGGGTGVVPFISMLRQRAAAGSRVPVTLVFSARTRTDLLFYDELSRLASSDKSVNLDVTLTRESALGFRTGRIDAALITQAITAMNQPTQQVLICGSNPFVEAATEGAIAAGIDSTQIKTERYGV
jgi:glycine betaine catabolism B